VSENIQEKATTPVDIYQAIPAARPLSDFAVERVGDDLVILDGESMQYHTLNLAAAQIWQACTGANSTHRIASELGMPIELVESTVSELGEAGLLQSPSNHWDSTLNRRRASKLIAAGLIGAVGLPIVKSITAPDAASAASIGECAFGITFGSRACWVCGIFRCDCEAVTSGGSGFCCVCEGVNFASFTASDLQAALNQGPSYVWNGGEEEIPADAFEATGAEDPYLATDEEGNVDLEAIDALEQEAASETESVETMEEIAPDEAVESQVETGSEGEQEITEEQSS